LTDKEDFNNIGTRAQCFKAFYLRNLQIFVTTRVIVHGKLFQPSLMFSGNAGAYSRVGHLKGALLGKTKALQINIRLSWKGLPGTNTNLLHKFVNYGHKKFYNNDTSLTLRKIP